MAVEGEVEKPSQKSMANNTAKRKNQQCIIVVELVIGTSYRGMVEAFFAMVLIVCVYRSRASRVVHWCVVFLLSSACRRLFGA
mmetsp:Transcript_3919/g.7865  ORF Transcript_3919/g.7865 Transcript_3919/m.7865 type:complete len:83 (+) Transcript_3919:1129-1377(+)